MQYVVFSEFDNQRFIDSTGEGTLVAVPDILACFIQETEQRREERAETVGKRAEKEWERKESRTPKRLPMTPLS